VNFLETGKTGEQLSMNTEKILLLNGTQSIEIKNDLPDVSIVITEDIFTSERSYAGLRFAHASSLRGNKVHLILFGKSIELALKKNRNEISHDKWENRQLWLEEFHEEGGMVYACFCYCYNHSITESDLLRYVPITKTEQLVDLVIGTKIHLVF
jgi:predicted peroxiredoxin